MEFSELNPEEFARVWERVTAGEESPVEPRRPSGPRPPRPPERPEPRPPRPPERPEPRPPRPPRPEPPLGPGCRGCEGMLRRMIDEELERSRSARGANVPGWIASQAQGRAKRLAAALYLISGEWYFPRWGRVERWPSRRAALRGLFRQSQQLEEGYEEQAERQRDPALRQLFAELARECRMEQHRLRHLLEV